MNWNLKNEMQGPSLKNQIPISLITVLVKKILPAKLNTNQQYDVAGTKKINIKLNQCSIVSKL